jgi:hypothetical protein
MLRSSQSKLSRSHNSGDLINIKQDRIKVYLLPEFPSIQKSGSFYYSINVKQFRFIAILTLAQIYRFIFHTFSGVNPKNVHVNLLAG